MPAIYRAAIDDKEWLPLLRRLAIELDSGLAVLVTIDKVRGRVSAVRYAGPRDEIRRDLVVERFPVEQDLLYGATRNSPAGYVYRSADFLPFETLKASPLYEVLLRPLGVREAVAVIVENDATFYTSFGFWYRGRAGAQAPRVLATLDALLPHLTAAVHVNRRLREAEAAHWGALTALQFARHGVILLSHRGELTYANRVAERILRSRDGLSLDGNRLRLGDEGLQARFDGFVTSAIDEPADATEAGFRIPRRSRRLPYDVLVLPRASRADYGRIPAGAAFTVILSDPMEVFAIARSTLVRHYGLTGSEAQLCRALLRTGDLSRAAGACDITPNTARTHLKRVFAKLRVTSQAQLLQWLGSSIRPAGGAPLEEIMLGE